MDILFHPEVKNDINILDGSIKKRLKKALKKIKRAPELGKPLGSKRDKDLSGCLKIYFYKKKYRIVYEIMENERIIVWSIGKREEEVVYLNAYKRILKREE
ncbi:MAG: type II toxin-antitoxin system RelE/ParE family toxin [Bacillota bacterium]